MTLRRRFTIPTLGLALAALALPALAGGEWYEDYEAGKGNCDNGNYGTCIAKMNAAIAKKPKSEKGARTYGVNFIDYTPYYYLGLAHFNQGNIPKAVDNFNKEADYGVIYKTANSGSFSVMSKQAAAALAAASKPVEPPPAPKPVETPPAPKPVETPTAAPVNPAPTAPTPAANPRNPPPTVIIYRSAPAAAPTASVPAPATAPTPVAPVTGEGAATAVRGAVKNLLGGDYGPATIAMESEVVARHYQNNAGYNLLLAYGYFCRSFAQPDRDKEFLDKAKSYVQKAAKANNGAGIKPDPRLFPRKFIDFYNNNL